MASSPFPTALRPIAGGVDGGNRRVRSRDRAAHFRYSGRRQIGVEIGCAFCIRPMKLPASRHRALRRREIPDSRELFSSDAGSRRICPLRTEIYLLLGRFPGMASRETGGSEQRASNAGQGITASASPRLFRINPDAICNAIAAIFAALCPRHHRPVPNRQNPWICRLCRRS